MVNARALAFLGLASMIGGFAHADKRGRELLIRGMGPGFGVNVVATLVQRAPSGAYQTFEVIRARDGKVRFRVLQPAQVLGTITVDDGERNRTYRPHQRVLMDQASMLRERQSARQRVALAERNYIISVTGERRVAGRIAVVVTAKPRHAGIDERRYAFDPRTGFPLRLDTVDASGEATMAFEVRSLSYPKNLTSESFELRTPNEVKYIQYPRPVPVPTKAEARRKVGFTPRLPTTLPFGFRVRGMLVDTTREWKRLAVRISDGLVHATVYQWLPTAEGAIHPAVAQGDTLEDDGVQLMIVSPDLSRVARERLLRAFVRGSVDFSPSFVDVILP